MIWGTRHQDKLAGRVFALDNNVTPCHPAAKNVQGLKYAMCDQPQVEEGTKNNLLLILRLIIGVSSKKLYEHTNSRLYSMHRFLRGLLMRCVLDKMWRGCPHLPSHFGKYVTKLCEEEYVRKILYCSVVSQRLVLDGPMEGILTVMLDFNSSNPREALVSTPQNSLKKVKKILRASLDSSSKT